LTRRLRKLIGSGMLLSLEGEGGEGVERIRAKGHGGVTDVIRGHWIGGAW
jgi:hypothetical protein